MERAVRKIRSAHRDPLFVYEAGPCGFWLYRRLRSQGLRCRVVSPSMTPRRSGDRVKTDRRDALMLARLARAGELIRPARLHRGGLGLRAPRAGVLGDRAPAHGAEPTDHRSCVEGAASAVRAVPAPGGAPAAEEQGGGGHCARALGVRVGDRARGQAEHLSTTCCQPYAGGLSAQTHPSPDRQRGAATAGARRVTRDLAPQYQASSSVDLPRGVPSSAHASSRDRVQASWLFACPGTSRIPYRRYA